MGRIFVDAIDFGLFVVDLEFAAEHFDVGRPTRKCVGCRVHADESFAGFDEIEEGVLVWKREVAGGVGEDDGVVFFEGVAGHFLFDVVAAFAVRAAAGVMDIHKPVCSPRPAMTRSASESRGDESPGCGDDEEMFGRGVSRKSQAIAAKE